MFLVREGPLGFLRFPHDFSAKPAATLSRAAKRGVSNGGGPIWTCPSFSGAFLSFVGLSRFSGIFPISSGMVQGFSRFVLFLFLGLSGAPTRNSPERVRATIWTLRAQRLKKINLDLNFQSRLKISISLEIFNPGPSQFPTKKRGLVGGSLEDFNLDWKFQSRRAILIFFNLWALRGPFPKKVGNPPVWKPPCLASLNTCDLHFSICTLCGRKAAFLSCDGHFFGYLDPLNHRPLMGLFNGGVP